MLLPLGTQFDEVGYKGAHGQGASPGARPASFAGALFCSMLYFNSSAPWVVVRGYLGLGRGWLRLRFNVAR